MLAAGVTGGVGREPSCLRGVTGEGAEPARKERCKCSMMGADNRRPSLDNIGGATSTGCTGAEAGATTGAGADTGAGTTGVDLTMNLSKSAFISSSSNRKL